jgi:ornithine cyclodeaminase/alanine dehydrogenase-like protein (mu-crystallin family)
VSEGILYLGRRDVLSVLARIDPAPIVRRALELHGSGKSLVPPEAYLGWSTPNGGAARSLSMPGGLDGGDAGLGVKIINSSLSNQTLGLPRASGLTLLFDRETARVRCMLEAAEISALRTACVSLISAQAFAAEPPRRLALVGAGTLARAHLALFAKQLPSLEDVRLFDLEPARADTLAAGATPLLDGRLRSVGSAREAVETADLVVTVTTTTAGYLGPDWLAAGAVLVHVSLDDALPETVLRADRLFVDDWSLVCADDHRLLGRMWRAGLLAAPDGTDEPDSGSRRVDGEIGEVLVGAKPGRLHAGDVVFVNPFGLAIEDVALAEAVYARARELGVGEVLER